MPADFAHALTHLYQPLIGIQAISLYMTLLHEIELQQDSAVQTHHTLMNYMDLPLDDLYRTRRKLEGIGLLKTFQEQANEYNIYTYELHPAFCPVTVFMDEMLAQLLYHHIGKVKFAMLKDHFAKPHRGNQGVNITASFGDVFQTVLPDEGTLEKPAAESRNLHERKPEQSTEPDFSWMERVLKQRMIPAEQVLTQANRQLIAQMMTLYDMPEYEVEKAVLWALTEENALNQNEFKEACHDLFQNNHQAAVRLTEKQPDTTEETITHNPTTKRNS